MVNELPVAPVLTDSNYQVEARSVVMLLTLAPELLKNPPLPDDEGIPAIRTQPRKPPDVRR